MQGIAAKTRGAVADRGSAMLRTFHRLCCRLAQPFGRLGQRVGDELTGAIGGLGGAVACHRIEAADARFQIADQWLISRSISTMSSDAVCLRAMTRISSS